jgi:hypothetical protein
MCFACMFDFGLDDFVGHVGDGLEERGAARHELSMPSRHIYLNSSTHSAPPVTPQTHSVRVGIASTHSIAQVSTCSDVTSGRDWLDWLQEPNEARTYGVIPSRDETMLGAQSLNCAS